MITIKPKEDIEMLREGGKRLAKILREVVNMAYPGISTYELDRRAERLIFDSGGTPAFKGYTIRGEKTAYPASMCISVNDEVVHAIPKKSKVLQEGDVVGFDIGMRWPVYAVSGSQPPALSSPFPASGKKGLFTDMAVTVGIGKVSKDAERLIRVTEEALETGIHAVRAGVHTGDISNAIQKHLEKHGLGIIRDLAGHGVGYELHEDPLIPNYGKRGSGALLKEGMVIALEPMATLGGWKVFLDSDRWTFRTRDKSIAAHFEHTIAVTKKGCEVITQCS